MKQISLGYPHFRLVRVSFFLQFNFSASFSAVELGKIFSGQQQLRNWLDWQSFSLLHVANVQLKCAQNLSHDACLAN